MKAFKCDRCGAYFETTTRYERYVKKTGVFRISVSNEQQSTINIYDLCEDCKKSFKAFMGKD